ncbi:MAG: hypothetical protein IKM15_07070 [Peptococcaceae bacterium]|nr:hypothetical protein [Peptococcaceae bacterium]
MRKYICLLTLICSIFLAACGTVEEKTVTKDDYLAELAIPMLRQVGEEMINLGSFADDMQRFCVSSEEVRQNFDYILLAERLEEVCAAIQDYPKDSVPRDCKRLHTTMLDLSSALEDFLTNYPETLMSKDEKKLAALFQNIYKHLNTGLNSLPDSRTALTEGEVAA